MTYSWQNDAGEPIMSGEAWRFEQQLDLDAQADYEADRFYDEWPDEPECEEDHACDSCEGPGGIWDREGNFHPHPGQVWHCTYCDRPCPEGAHED